MKKSFEEIKKDLLSKNISPIYLLTGDESYYIDLLTKCFEEDIMDEADKDFNFFMAYGKDTNSEIILNNSKQYPLMSQYRLVIIKEAQDMDKKEYTKLESYLSNPISSTILVICYKYNKFPANLIKIIDKKGVVFESKKIPDYKLIGWISDYAKSQKLNLDQEAINIISESLGNNLEKITNELSKLILNIKPGASIGGKDIERFIGISRNYNSFELQSSLGKRDILKASDNKLFRC